MNHNYVQYMKPGRTYSFADVALQNLVFSTSIPSQAIILSLLDTPWFQRLRDIFQTANTRLVYMFSEHSRFGHSLGVSFLAETVMEKLSRTHPQEIEPYRCAVAAAALLHDVGHLAPGSHSAFKAWYPGLKDSHEDVAVRVINEDQTLSSVLQKFGSHTLNLVEKILMEDPSLPPWTWELISGGGWNVDRGNWCIVDSILAGVSYGKYNVSALTESITLTNDGHIALLENRLDSMIHFSVSRHAMYRQVYHHRVLLSADTLNNAIIKRARDIRESLPFCDEHMDNALRSQHPNDLPLDTIFEMRESWWRYHLGQWRKSKDKILSDLSSRLLDRRLFKTVRILEEDNATALINDCKKILNELGLDPEYYLHRVSTTDTHVGESKQPMVVLMEDGSRPALATSDPLFEALGRMGTKTWLAMPEDAKRKLGRER